MRLSRTEHAAFLAALDGGEEPDPRGDPVALLLRAVRAAKDGRFEDARADMDTAIADAPTAGIVHVVAGVISYVTRDYSKSLALLRTAAERDPNSAATAYRLIAERAARLGWTADEREALEAFTRLRSKSLRARIQTIRVLVRGRAWRPALEELRAATEIEAVSPALWIERASVASRTPTEERTHRGNEVETCVNEALRLEPPRSRYELPYLMEGASVLLRAGRIESAEARLRQALALAPDASDVVMALAELSLWRGQYEEAAKAAEQVLGWDASDPAARRVLGAIEVREGRFAAALAHLPEDLEDYRGQVWRGEALLGLGRLDESHAALTRASMRSDGFLSVAWVLRLRLSLRDNPKSQRFEPSRFGEVRDLLLAVDADGGLGAREVLSHGRYPEADELFAAVLARLAGNRSTTPTVLSEGVLRRLGPLEGEREASRRALELIRAATPEEALAELRAVSSRFEGHSLPDAHHGELLLWLGRYDESRAMLNRSITTLEETRWPYIGLTCLDILAGDCEQALKTSAHGVQVMKNTEGPAVFVHRGEALRRLGRNAEARADLEKAVELHPGRISAWLNLALVAFAEGESATKAVQMIFDRAPGLLSDAAASLGRPLWAQRDADPTDLPALFERALVLLRGNRASTLITYRTDEGRLRYVPQLDASRRSPNDGDEDDLMRARGMLLKAAGLQKAKPKQAVRRKRSPAQSRTEEFLERSYIKLPGAFSAEVAASWRQQAIDAIRRAPGRYVRGYQGQPLSEFDPKDVKTWSMDRIDCHLDGRATPYKELMPDAWEVIATLLGGEHRISTRDMGLYLILNLCEKAEFGQMPPSRQWKSWHMDDPSVRTRLDDFRNGVVLIALFDDVPLDRGPTYIAPESIREVSRTLAASPDGVDFVNRSTAV
ncbi:MAG: tetratricopeptide repeat protein, partial [Myxococcota bacterium]